MANNPAQVLGETILVTELIDKCVEDGINWQISSTLCDTVNRSPYISIEASKLLKDKLKNFKRPDIQLASVELMESLIKNCPHTHLTIGSKKYQNSIIKLVSNKKLDDRVKESLLNAIQNIASAFRMLPQQHQQHFLQTHLHLKVKGFNFPPEPEKPAFNAPYLKSAKEPNSPGTYRFKLAPPGSPSMQRNNHQTIPKDIPPAMTAQDICKTTEECVVVLSEAITSVPPSELKHNEIVTEMAENLRQYQRTIQEWIQAGSQSETNLASLLQANDSAETILTVLKQSMDDSQKTVNNTKDSKKTTPQEEPDLLGSWSVNNNTNNSKPSAPELSPHIGTTRNDSFGRIEPPPLLNRTASTSTLNADGTPKSRRRVTPNSPPVSPAKPQQTTNHQRVPSTLIDLSTPPAQQLPPPFNPTFETSTSFFPPVNFPPSPVPVHHFQSQPQNNIVGFGEVTKAPPSPSVVRSPQQLEQLFDELALDAFGPSPTPSPQISRNSQNPTWTNQSQSPSKQSDTSDLLGLF